MVVAGPPPHDDIAEPAAISVVIPAYNAAAFLADAVASVRAQTRAALEIVVVDDGSTDGTPALAASLGVRCLTTPRNGGPSLARNVGIQAARGALVAFLDADDWWQPEHLERVAALLDRHPDVVVAFGGVRQRRADGSVLPDEGAAAPPRRHPFAASEPADALWALVAENRLAQSAAVVRRQALLDAGGYHEALRHAEDYDLWLRLALTGRFARSDAVTLEYRLHPAQATQATVAMVTGWWTARARLAARVARQRPDLAPQLAVALGSAWDADARWAWRSGDDALLQTVLGLRAQVPGALGGVPMRWRVRARYAWPVWQRVIGAWDALPPPVRRALNRVRGR